MKQLRAIASLARWREYYGTVVFLSLLGLIFSPGLPWTKVLLVVGANLLSGAFAFMINDVEDWKDDLQDPAKMKRNPISAGLMSENLGRIASCLVAFASLSLYFMAGTWVFGVGVIGIILGYLYSCKRIRLKSMPGLDIASHGIFLGVVYFIATVAIASAWAHPLALALVSALIFLMSVMGDLVNEIRDYKVDSETGIKNTAQIFKLNRFSKAITMLATLMAPAIFLYSVWFLPLDGKIMLALILVPLVAHFGFYYFKNRGNIYSYPYQQQGLTMLGVGVAMAGRA